MTATHLLLLRRFVTHSNERYEDHRYTHVPITSRAARDNNYLPIVIGDATGTQKPEQLAGALERINNFFAPVISSDTFVRLLGQQT